MKIQILNLGSKIIINGEYNSLLKSIEENKHSLTYADLHGADLHGANLTGANLTGANLCCADLIGADLRHADLHGADLYGADLYGADLRHADLHGADLHGADLHGANLQGTDLKIHFIVGSSHVVQFLDNNIKIGCEYHSLAYWLVMYDVIGKENNYTDEQIKEYHEYIKSCKEL